MGLMSGDDRLWVNVNCGGQFELRHAEKLREIKAPLQLLEEQQVILREDCYLRLNFGTL